MKNPKSLILSLVGLLVITFSAAGGTSVEGVVKDSTGHPIKAANVRIEAKNFSKIVRTNASGHYICDGLGVGTYRVTLVLPARELAGSPRVNGQLKAILDAKTQAGKATQLNFNLTGVSNVERIDRPIPYGKNFMEIRVHSANSDE